MISPLLSWCPLTPPLLSGLNDTVFPPPLSSWFLLLSPPAFSLSLLLSHTAPAGSAGPEAPAGAAGAPEEDGAPPPGAGGGEAAAGAQAAAAQEQGAGPGE